MKDGNYYGALDAWLIDQPPHLMFLFVQFEGVVLGEAPRAQLARPNEIIAHMKTPTPLYVKIIDTQKGLVQDMLT